MSFESLADLFDYNGDGYTDILWRNTATGEALIWLMNGNNIIGQTTFSLSLDWSIESVGDYNRDNKTDILWRNTATGENVAWLMDGVTIAGAVTLPTLSSVWTNLSINPTRPPTQFNVGTGEFNGDGQSDLIWRNTQTGENVMWLMNGFNVPVVVPLPTFGLEWNPISFANYDNNEQPNQQTSGQTYQQTDILWRNSQTGENVIWFMQDGNIARASALPAVDINWDIPVDGDFNGDGTNDILWRNNVTGENIIWLMNGANIIAAGSPGTIDLVWAVTAVGDYNGDGKTDIIWGNNETGRDVVWGMNGVAIAGASDLPSVSIDWDFSSVTDFNNDEITDIGVRLDTTGRNVMWGVVGGDVAGAGNLPDLPLDWVAYLPYTDPNVLPNTLI